MKVIQIERMTKQFSGRVVLNDISLEVEKGEVFGFLGPNGAGKTTTLRVLLGLLRPTTGKALVFGQELGQDEVLRRQVGVLLENDGLYSRLSAFANLDYYAGLYEVRNPAERADELLEFVGLHDRRNDRVGDFSTGMRRKLGLARALIHEPEVLFFDEPTSGLDPEAQKMMRDLIIRLSGRAGITVFLNSHHLDEVQRLCSRVAILHEGRIRANDSVQNLRRRAGQAAVEIELAYPADGPSACRALTEAGLASSCEMNGTTVVAKLGDGGSREVIKLLVRGGIEIEEVKKAVTSLEDVYLKIVQQPGRGGGDDA